VWRAAGIELRRVTYCRSWLMRCDGSTVPAVGVNSSPGMRRARRIRARLRTLAGPP
jgi:hypothetical protein